MDLQLKDFIEGIVTRMGFADAQVSVDEEGRRISVIIDDGDWVAKKVPDLVSALRQLTRGLARKNSLENYFIDINNYKKERERLIVEIGQAGAKKAVFEKVEVALPAMNSYERRLVHADLSMRPDVKTESAGEGKERHIIIKPL
ncbi:MAG: R3H domain-containing nucleic acid-binding protein [Candidatus Paceibacterota bacterium]